MTAFHLEVNPGVVLFRLLSSPGADVEENCVEMEEVRPGEEWRGLTYDDLRQIGSGHHDADAEGIRILFEEPPILSEEDERLLDRIWDEIGEENRIREELSREGKSQDE